MMYLMSALHGVSFSFQDGLVKSNMDKLTFFAMKSPDKLNRIALYLAKRLSRDVSRQRIGSDSVHAAASCHGKFINLAQLTCFSLLIFFST